MSKKKLRSRLDSLFSELEREVTTLPLSGTALPKEEVVDSGSSSILTNKDHHLAASGEVGIVRDLDKDPIREEDQNTLLNLINFSPIRLETGKQDDRGPEPVQHAAPSALSVPIRMPEKSTRLLEVVADTPGRVWSEDERRLVEQVADQLTLALENAHLFQAEQRRANELNTLVQLSRMVSQNLDLEEIYQTAYSIIVGLMPVKIFSINLIDEDRNEFISAYVVDSGIRLPPQNFSADAGIFGYVRRTYNPYIAHNSAREAIPFSPAEPGGVDEHVHSIIAVPLLYSGELMGVLSVQSDIPGIYREYELNMLQTYADHLAIAIHNSRLYEEQRQLTEQLREVDKLKSQFLANMSHELRTPLNSIIGFSRLILKGIDGPINDNQRQDLAAIYHSGSHLLRLINNILDISKIEAGKMELSFETGVNLIDLINSVMSTTVALVKDKPIRLEKVIQPGLPTVTADPIRINQVMLNLLSNASKFTEKGSITLEAGAQTSSAGQPEVIIKVMDTGEGINEQDQKRLFQPFSQVDESATRKTGGSGLGLFISRSLVEMHGGQIGVDSQPGVGSVFWFTIPLIKTP